MIPDPRKCQCQGYIYTEQRQRPATRLPDCASAQLMTMSSEKKQVLSILARDSHLWREVSASRKGRPATHCSSWINLRLYATAPYPSITSTRADPGCVKSADCSGHSRSGTHQCGTTVFTLPASFKTVPHALPMMFAPEPAMTAVEHVL